MRDAFAVLFFVSVGMLLDPGALLASPGLVVGRARRRARRQAARRAADRVGDALSAQRGADGRDRAGADRRVLVHPRDASGATWACSRPPPPTRSSPPSIVSIVAQSARCTAPSDRSSAGLRRGRGLRRVLNRAPSMPADLQATRSGAHRAIPRHRAVVIGYGPTGRTVVRLLRENGIAPTVDRAEHGHRARAAAGRHRRGLRRCHASGDAGGRRRGAGPAA